MSNITNINDKICPFIDAAKGDDESGPVQDGLVHVRIQRRKGRKTLTTIQGLSVEHDILEAIFKTFKKEFACNGNVIEHSEYGKVLQLQGDQRTKVCAWLSNPKIGLVRADQ
jgi:translation initiation factor 1